jgi:esterase/lipase superfamily enzyme
MEACVLREYNCWLSERLHRQMEFLWFGHAGRPVLVFPTSMGRFHQNEDSGLVGALADMVDAGQIQFVCVDSVDEESWYHKNTHPANRVQRHDQYDRYLRHELVPYIHNRANRKDLVLFGASFGAYHAANFAARYPELAAKAILFSGIYDIHRYLDDYWDDLCYFHCPTAYVPNMDASWTGRLGKISWIIATGEYDSLVQDNRDFSALLCSKGIANHTEIWPGVFGHDWLWWKENLRSFLP